MSAPDDWEELDELGPDGIPRPLLVRRSAIRSVRPEHDSDGAVIELGTTIAPVHVTQPYRLIRERIR